MADDISPRRYRSGDDIAGGLGGGGTTSPDVARLLDTDATNRVASDGKAIWRCLLLADAKPATMPLTGATISGMADDVHIGAGSIMVVLGEKKTYVLGNDESTWYDGSGW